MTRSDQNVISDVRSAKQWLDSQATTLQQHAQRLAVVQQAYADRTGAYAAVPRTVPASVRSAIESAANEPGSALLSDTSRDDS